MELKALGAFVVSLTVSASVGCGDDGGADGSASGENGSGATESNGATDGGSTTDGNSTTEGSGATDGTGATSEAETTETSDDDDGGSSGTEGGETDSGETEGVCGDRVCDAAETCEDCPTDCGPCNTPKDWPAEIPPPWDGWDALPENSEVIESPAQSGDTTFSCTGSPGNIAGLTANEPIVGTTDDVITINADYCVIHDVVFQGYVVRVVGDHYVIRDSEVDGAGRTGKNGLSLSGNDGVAYRNTSHHLLGNDRHCYTNGGGATDTWFIENEGYYCTGDGYQAGHQMENNRPTNIYLVRNHMHDNRENGLDYKFVQNVWAVENTLNGFVASSGDEPWCFPDAPEQCATSSSGSDGSAVVVGSDGGPIDSYHIRNIIYDSGTAIRVEAGFGETHIIGNEFTNIENRCLALDKDGMEIEFTGNLCRDADRGIFQNWRDNFGLNVADNTFEDITGPALEYESGAVIDASTLTNNAFDNTGPVIYNNTSASSAAEINALPQASGNTVSP